MCNHWFLPTKEEEIFQNPRRADYLRKGKRSSEVTLILRVPRQYFDKFQMNPLHSHDIIDVRTFSLDK